MKQLIKILRSILEAAESIFFNINFQVFYYLKEQLNLFIINDITEVRQLCTKMLSPNGKSFGRIFLLLLKEMEEATFSLLQNLFLGLFSRHL